MSTATNKKCSQTKIKRLENLTAEKWSGHGAKTQPGLTALRSYPMSKDACGSKTQAITLRHFQTVGSRDSRLTVSPQYNPNARMNIMNIN